jgi:hypothetical protein
VIPEFELIHDASDALRSHVQHALAKRLRIVKRNAQFIRSFVIMLRLDLISHRMHRIDLLISEHADFSVPGLIFRDQ